MDNDYSSKALFDFLRQATMRGMLNPAAARSRKNAAEQLFSKLTDEEHADLRRVEVDDLCGRFHKLQGSTIRVETLRIYGTRLSAAIDDFIRSIDNPRSFTATPGESKSIRRRSEPGEPLPQSGEDQAKERLELDPPRDAEEVFPIPIRPGHVVYVQKVPLDMTRAEANKICAVVQALVACGEEVES
ncbi:MAG: hypothetical protein DHS20C11_07440 [Lysobacteraceae bacterium]|nr:MAG: hypothetical protein DHS20C11_07440 [Xanthomonadaceae bacterium]